MNILELITGDGFTFKRVAATHGGEYAGPCPFCGGNDRFRIWPEHKGGRYWCRACEKKGDIIQYIRDTRNMTYFEALDYLGIDKPQQAHKSQRRKHTGPTPFKPKTETLPPPLWMEKASRFLKWSQDQLWTPNGRAARDILFNKGLTDETIRRAGIGFNPAELYRDRRGWGLAQEIPSDGKPKWLWIPVGLVIPLQDHERPVRLRIRFNKPLKDQRYTLVPGSSSAQLVLKSEVSNHLLVVESELDAWLVWQEARDLAGVVAMGAAGMKPDVSAHELLLKSEKILNGLDYDEAGARYAWKFWPETYGQKVIRWPVPIGKDPSDAWQRGLNIRAWIEAGIED